MYYRVWKELDEIDMTEQARNTLEEIYDHSTMANGDIRDSIERYLIDVCGDGDETLDEQEVADYLHHNTATDIMEECQIDYEEEEEEEDEEEEEV